MSRRARSGVACVVVRGVVGAALVAVLATVIAIPSGHRVGAAVMDAEPPPYPSTVKTTLNVPYSDASPLDVLDVVQPGSGGENGMAIVLVHGGGWTSGDKAEMDEVAGTFAQAGWVAFNMNYSLNGYPNESNDVFAAIAWIRGNAATYGVDPNRIAVLGSSAGGTLAGIVATEGAANGEPVSAVASWSGPMDLAALVNGSQPGTYEYQQPITYVGGCTPSQCPSTYDAASPVDHVSPGTAPMLLANSTDEVIPLSQAQEMDNALIAAGVPQELDAVPGTQHATAYQSVETAPTMAFLTRYTEAGAAPAASGAAAPTTVPAAASRAAAAGTATTTSAPRTATTTTAPRTATTSTTDPTSSRTALHAGGDAFWSIVAAVAAVLVVALLALGAGWLDRKLRRSG
ncbi:MAG: alpha/beta hydrolase [Acidimicrobiales bacterium]